MDWVAWNLDGSWQEFINESQCHTFDQLVIRHLVVDHPLGKVLEPVQNNPINGYPDLVLVIVPFEVYKVLGKLELNIEVDRLVEVTDQVMEQVLVVGVVVGVVVGLVVCLHLGK